MLNVNTLSDVRVW